MTDLCNQEVLYKNLMNCLVNWAQQSLRLWRKFLSCSSSQWTLLIYHNGNGLLSIPGRTATFFLFHSSFIHLPLTCVVSGEHPLCIRTLSWVLTAGWSSKVDLPVKVLLVTCSDFAEHTWIGPHKDHCQCSKKIPQKEEVLHHLCFLMRLIFIFLNHSLDCADPTNWPN